MTYSSNAVASIPPSKGNAEVTASDNMLAAARIRAEAEGRRDWMGAGDRRIANRLEQIARSKNLPSWRTEIGAGRELVNQEMRGIRGVVDTVEHPDYVAADASRVRLELADQAGVLTEGLDAADTIQAKDSLEKMAVHQMAAAHASAMRLMARVKEDLENYSVLNPRAREAANIQACRSAIAAARLMGAFQSVMLAIQRKRSGGQQHVKVTHIHQQVMIEHGGQAVVADEAAGDRGAHRNRGGSKNGA